MDLFNLDSKQADFWMRLDQFRFPPAGRTTTLQKLGSQPIETPRLRLRVRGYPLRHSTYRGIGQENSGERSMPLTSACRA